MKFSKKLIIFFVVAFVLRLVLIFTAHHGDLNNNVTWATVAYEEGLRDFYERAEWEYSAPNQPPLTILMFAGIRALWQFKEDIFWWLNNNFRIFPSPLIWFWESQGMLLLIKLPSILADLGIAALIYQYIKRKTKSKKSKEKLAFTFTFIWLFNPITWYNSSVWGQTDSIVNLLGLVAVFSLLNNNLAKFAVFMTLSLLFKGSLAIFIPILLYIAWLQKHKVTNWLTAAFYSLLATFLMTVWFHPQSDLPIWLFNLYKNRILPGEIGYLTANAFNFWWLVNPGRVLDSAVYLGLPARVWGFAIALLGTAGIIFWLSRKKLSDLRIFFSLTLISIITFLFMTRIHERYLYPFFPYATILLAFLPAMWLPYFVLSVTHLLNLYHLFWVPSIPFLEALFGNPVLPQALAVVNILILVYFLRQTTSAKI